MYRFVSSLFALLLFIASAMYTTEAVGQSSQEKIVQDFHKSRRHQRRTEVPAHRTKDLLNKSYGEQIYYQTGSVAQGQLAPLLYKTPSYYPCGYTYTAVLTPLSGDPDLYLHERVNGTWRKLKESINGGTTTDSFTFTCANITPTATNVDLDVKGYTAASYNFALYRQANSAGFKLQFPLSTEGYTPSTTPVTAVVDLYDRSKANGGWNRIETRTGEYGTYSDGCLAYVNGANVACTASNESAPWAYKRPGGAIWSVGGINYLDYAPGTNVYMWYDNHTGYDYAVPRWENVTAAAEGDVTGIISSLGQVEITHSNGYKTYYLHMDSIQVGLGAHVYAGTLLGEVSDVGAPGAVHLHFTVRDANGKLLDPYGVPGSYDSMWQ